MATDLIELGDARRDALLQSALGVFLRYGYKKTSMDDLARAVGLSRQGLYLHFPNKEALFKECVIFLTRQSLANARAALARDELALEERLLGSFVALKLNSDGSDMSQEHMAELFATATQLVGPALEELNRALVANLAVAIEESGLAAKWKDAAISAQDLALHLHAASYGIKHSMKTPAEYRERMRVAVRIVCEAAQ
jgi:AcrR family transcriptional regulator